MIRTHTFPFIMCSSPFCCIQLSLQPGCAEATQPETTICWCIPLSSSLGGVSAKSYRSLRALSVLAMTYVCAGHGI